MSILISSIPDSNFWISTNVFTNHNILSKNSDWEFVKLCAEQLNLYEFHYFLLFVGNKPCITLCYGGWCVHLDLPNDCLSWKNWWEQRWRHHDVSWADAIWHSGVKWFMKKHVWQLSAHLMNCWNSRVNEKFVLLIYICIILTKFIRSLYLILFSSNTHR